MTAQTRLYTVADLEAMPKDGIRRELIAGELVETPHLERDQMITMQRLIEGLTPALPTGGTLIPNFSCHLAHDPDTLLTMDCGYVSAERVVSPPPDGYWSFAPDLAIHVIQSDGDRDHVYDRVKWYFQNGARLVWVLCVEEQDVELHTPTRYSHFVGRNEMLNGGDVLPDFSALVKTLFEDADMKRKPTVVDLPTAVLEAINTFRYDRILEKHEGPERWNFAIRHAEIIEVNGYNVLLPIGVKNIPNIEILRCIVSQNGNTLTLFLKDRTFTKPEDEYFDAGRIAICDKIPGTDVYIAVVYHEWFAVENEGMP